MFKVGDTLTVINDLVTISGNINLKSGQRMIIRELKTTNGYWSGDIWISPKVFNPAYVLQK